MRKLLCLLVIAASVVSWGGEAQAADEVDNRNVYDFHKVDTYFSTTYRLGTGDCKGNYKIINAQYRFNRKVVDRYVKVQQFRMFSAASANCSGNEFLNRKFETSHDACFGCNGTTNKWSRTYSYSPGWPYQRRGDWAILHTKLRVQVRAPGSSSVVNLGSFCKGTYRFGDHPC